MMLKRADGGTGKCERSQASEEEIEMGKKVKQELKTLKSQKRAVVFGKKAKELLQKCSVDILLSVVISACDEQGKKIITELFTYEMVKLVVIHVAYRLIWVCIFWVWGYIVESICQRVWHKVRIFIKKIRSRNR